jgi:Zn-dependent protease
MAIAAAGPASNIVLAVLASVLLRLMAPAPTDPLEGDGGSFGALATLLESAIFINVLLAVFNMVPVPPLDGGNVLAGLLRGPVGDAFERLRPYGFLILYGLMLTGLLTTIITPPARFLLSLLL